MYQNQSKGIFEHLIHGSFYKASLSDQTKKLVNTYEDNVSQLASEIPKDQIRDVLNRISSIFHDADDSIKPIMAGSILLSVNDHFLVSQFFSNILSENSTILKLTFEKLSELTLRAFKYLMLNARANLKSSIIFYINRPTSEISHIFQSICLAILSWCECSSSNLIDKDAISYLIDILKTSKRSSLLTDPSSSRGLVGALFILKLVRFLQYYSIYQDTPDQPSIRKTRQYIEQKNNEIRDLYIAHISDGMKMLPKEILLVLYNIKTYRQMKSDYPFLYGSHLVIKNESLLSSNRLLMNHLLSYSQRSILEELFQKPKQHQNIIPNVYQNSLPTYDYDLATSDLIRYSLHSLPPVKPSQKAEVMMMLFSWIANQLKKPLYSFQSLFIDLIYLDSDMPVIQIVPHCKHFFDFIKMDHKFFSSFQSRTFELLSKRISNEFDEANIRVIERSLSFVIQTFESQNEIHSFAEIARNFLRPTEISPLLRICDLAEKDVVPSIVKQFIESKENLSSHLGEETLISVSQKLQHLLQYQPNQAQQFVKDLISPFCEGENEMKIIEYFEPLPLALFFSQSPKNSKFFLNWSLENNKFSHFDQTDLFSFDNYEKSLCELITSGTNQNWKKFLTDCTGFRGKDQIIISICLKCDLVEVKSISSSLDIKNNISRIVFLSAEWSPNSQANLLILLRENIRKPKDFLLFSDWFSSTISQLPYFVVQFFLSSCVLQGSDCDEVLQFVEKCKNNKNRDEAGIKFSHDFFKLVQNNEALLVQLETDRI
jgi:hypothetical protein